MSFMAQGSGPTIGTIARLGLVALALGLFGVASGRDAIAQSVLSYHNDPARSGRYVTPGLDWTTASGVHLDTGFSATISGNVYAQPLYWLPQGQSVGQIIVATESNFVYALNATTGAIVWQRQVGTAVRRSALPCGNIDPVGITGTPVIDPAAQIVYFDAMVHTSIGPRHMLYGLSLTDGSIAPGWPIDVGAGLKAVGRGFNIKAQGQRSALTLVNGQLFVSYAGLDGDCGTYRGWAVGFDLATPKLFAGWATRARGGGSWGQSGIAYDGTSMFLTTGNTMGTIAGAWRDGEAVIRLPATMSHSYLKADYFTPATWFSLDQADLDLGGTAAVPVDVPNASATLPRVLALGKDGYAYLLDRGKLGGIGSQLARVHVSTDQIRTAAAVYTVGTAAMVAFEGQGAQCPGAAGNLTVLSLTKTVLLATAWCASFSGQGAPIVTTTDPIVWVVGAEGDNLLHGFKGTDGTPLFTGGSSAMANLRHFQTILAANNHFYVASDNKIYAFAF